MNKYNIGDMIYAYHHAEIVNGKITKIDGYFTSESIVYGIDGCVGLIPEGEISLTKSNAKIKYIESKIQEQLGWIELCGKNLETLYKELKEEKNNENKV